MTGPEDSHSNTRPISVAELLAKNGTIGAPPVGGRRRRRRGNSDSVTVAELTGEIPIVPEHDHHGDFDDHDDAVTSRQRAVTAEEHAEPTGPVPITNGAGAQVGEAKAAAATESETEPAEDVDDDYADAVADYTAHIERRETDVDPVDFFAPPRRTPYAHGRRRYGPIGRGAEQMSPDPVDEDEGPFDAPIELAEEPGVDDIEDSEAIDADHTRAAVADRRDDELPSYMRSTSGALFGGQTVADDLARGAAARSEKTEDTEAEEHHDAVAQAGMSSVLRGAWVVGQCIIAVAFGAGLFIAFDQLWKWNNIVALVLSVLVILGLVVGVRVVRKTEDIGSTLIAVAVGALVTLGPLALLQSG